jgi:hypothetical protein
MVKVKDLIAALQALDPELSCCVMDQGGDWCTLDGAEVVTSPAIGYYDLDDSMPRNKRVSPFVAL